MNHVELPTTVSGAEQTNLSDLTVESAGLVLDRMCEDASEFAATMRSKGNYPPDPAFSDYYQSGLFGRLKLIRSQERVWAVNKDTSLSTPVTVPASMHSREFVQHCAFDTLITLGGALCVGVTLNHSYPYRIIDVPEPSDFMGKCFGRRFRAKERQYDYWKQGLDKLAERSA